MFIAEKTIPDSITIDDFKIIFRNVQVTEGVVITFKCSATLENCMIEKDCTIGSNIRNCHFDKERTLIIFGSQTSNSFSFNNIQISSFGYHHAISMIAGKIVFKNSGSIQIRGDKGIGMGNAIIEIENSGDIQLDSIDMTRSVLSINNSKSLSICGNMKLYESGLTIQNSSNLSLNLFRNGLISRGGNNIISTQNLFEIDSEDLSLGFCSLRSKWNNTTFLNNQPLKISEPIKLQNHCPNSKIDFKLKPKTETTIISKDSEIDNEFVQLFKDFGELNPIGIIEQEL